MQKNSILLVEDNADDEALTTRALKKGKVKNDLMVVRDGQEALDYLFCEGAYATRDPFNLPQLILLDLKLPKIDGLEVLRRIRANKKTELLPVVILTSSREDKDILAGYAGKANSYIVKPVNMEQFTQAIQELQVYWMVFNEIPKIS